MGEWIIRFLLIIGLAECESSIQRDKSENR